MEALTLPFLAVAAGVISFTSPCCLPLIPSYLSYVTALPVSELGTREARAVTLRSSLLFVAGFTVVFTALGASFAYVGSVLLANIPLIVRVAGVGIILMGLGMIGVIRMPWLYREWRPGRLNRPRGPWGAFPLGMAFAFGWVPCIGPVLAAILTTAASTQTAPWGAALLALYSLGLGIPFVVLGLGFQRLRGSVDWLRRHARRLEQIGGALLVGIGVLFISGAWRTFFIPLQRAFARLGWPPI
ncbi:MAG: sulfite exporter TauE/SafE family protein [Acidimicrobiia bacterium]|nr:sulfite exporter TauE/SafE family protein [Acidimicrobiia bacterium]MDQ3501188.1 cytochrome c biogenesis protein CcdA [Actinomycetota bacterium]